MNPVTSENTLEYPHWFEKIEQLGGQARQAGVVSLVSALLAHGAIAAYAAYQPVDVRLFAEEVHRFTLSRVATSYDIEVEEPPPPEPEPEPEPEKEPEPPAPVEEKPVPVVVPKDAPRDPSPAAPQTAEAGKVLTAEPDPNEPLDLTGEGFVSGTGTRFAGGVTSSTGTSTVAVRDVNARPDGVPGGTGTAPAAPQPAVDLSRPARPLAGSGWNDCGFPPEADAEQINQALVTLVVVVDENGRPKSASAVKDPGYGFGARAERCALRKSFEPSLDRFGKPKVGSTAPFTVRFTR
jgi:protein TonB